MNIIQGELRARLFSTSALVRSSIHNPRLLSDGSLTNEWTPSNPSGTSHLTADEIAMIEAQGGWTTIARPYDGTTPNNGLGAIFTALGTPQGVYGTDYGPTTAEGSMADVSLNSEWNAGQKKLKFKSTTAANDGNGNHLLTATLIADGGMDWVTGEFGMTVPAIVRDCAVRNPTGDINVGVAHQPPHPLTLENCLVTGQLNRNANLAEGTIRDCAFDVNGGDCLGVDYAQDVYVVNTFMRRPADPSLYGGTVPVPGPHADCIQGNAGVSGFSLVGSTLYMPHFGSTFAETNAEMNACVYLSALDVTDPNAQTVNEDCYILGNLLVGGTTSVVFRPRMDGGWIRNFVLAFNRYGNAAGYTGGLHLRMSAAEPGGNWANIAVFEEYDELGNKITYSTEFQDGSSDFGVVIPNFGVFSWDKSQMSPKWREVMWRIGLALGVTILDANGDLNPVYDLGALKVPEDLNAKTQWTANDFIANNWSTGTYAEVYSATSMGAARDGTTGSLRGSMDTPLNAGQYRLRGTVSAWAGMGDVTGLQMRLQINGVNITPDSGPAIYSAAGAVDTTFTAADGDNFRLIATGSGTGFQLDALVDTPIIERVV